MSVRGGHSGEARSCELGPGRERPWPPGADESGAEDMIPAFLVAGRWGVRPASIVT